MINRVSLPNTDLTASCIGAGCASLGSRISRADGLRALSSAFDRGVTWYDVAPAYGAGEAEEILGEFVSGRREQLVICSKVGVIPPKSNGLLRAVYAAARPLISGASGLRRKFRKVRATRNQTVPLTPELIATSIERSLQRLDTDHLDIFALHKPSVEALGNDEILLALQDIVASGKARYISVAGSEEAAMAAIARPEIFSLVQLADDPLTNTLQMLRESAGREPAFVTHSVLGVDGAKDRVVDALVRHPERRRMLEEAGYAGSNEEMASALLVDRALASNKHGVVLLSMFSERHQLFNVERASRPVNEASISLVQEALRVDDEGTIAR